MLISENSVKAKFAKFRLIVVVRGTRGCGGRLRTCRTDRKDAHLAFLSLAFAAILHPAARRSRGILRQ